MATPSEVRARILEIARRRQKPGTGSSLEFLRRRTAMKQWPDLTQVLGDIPWATVGGVATRHYMPEQVTPDLEILIKHAATAGVRDLFLREGFCFSEELPGGRSAWTAPDSSRIVVLSVNEPWVAVALEQARRNRDLQGLPVLPLPYLVLLKLRSGRLQDLADITRMLGQADDEQLEAVRDVIGRMQPDALADVESMITLGRLEFE
jgi:hypothetical protein